jgi:hypothetical protein
MPTTLIVTLIVGILLAIAASVCVVMAPRLPMAIRIVAGFLFVLLGLFCVFGFAAAMEPGDYHVVWRVGYAVLFLACLLAIGRLALAKNTTWSSNQATQD